jgi:hypothetical protein
VVRFGEFQQYAARRFRMDEGDPASSDAASGHLIDEMVAAFSTRCERLVEVGYAVAHMVNTGAPFCEKPSDRAVCRQGLHELDLHVAHVNGNNRGTVGCFSL